MKIKKFLSLILILILTINSQLIAFAKTSSTSSDTPVTIEYFTKEWATVPNVDIIESTEDTLILDYDGDRIEYYQTINNEKTQEVLIVEDGIENYLKYDLKSNKLFVNNSEIILEEVAVDEDKTSDNDYLTVSSSWSNPTNVKYYRVSFGGEILYELTKAALSYLFVKGLGEAYGICAAIASGVYSKRTDPDYRFYTGVYVKFYKQVDNDDYNSYRKVWECYGDDEYSDYMTRYTQLVME